MLKVFYCFHFQTSFFPFQSKTKQKYHIWLQETWQSHRQTSRLNSEKIPKIALLVFQCKLTFLKSRESSEEDVTKPTLTEIHPFYRFLIVCMILEKLIFSNKMISFPHSLLRISLYIFIPSQMMQKSFVPLPKLLRSGLK